MAFQNCMYYMAWSGLRKGHSLLFAKLAVETNVGSQNFGSKWEVKKEQALPYILQPQFNSKLFYKCLLGAR